MKVELIDHMGDDLRVANAARVSFAKESELDKVDCGHEDCGPECRGYYTKLSDKDAKLIHYLAKHGHWSPFSHCFLTFRIKAPIFVARQLQKHQVGLAWNEVSRRYVDDEPEFYMPDGWREKAENVKQGSGDIITEPQGKVIMMDAMYQSRMRDCLTTYQTLLDYGVCPEQARMVLPQSMYTEWYWSGSLYAFMRVVKQRCDDHAQKETQEVARQIALALKDKFPVSYIALAQTYT